MFTVEIQVKADKVLQGLSDMKTNLEKTEEPLSNSGKYMQIEAFSNFPAQGGAFDEAWPELKPSTIRKKEKLGFGGMPIMVRTGELFRSFFVRLSKNKVEVYNPVDYAIEHQLGDSEINLPRRVLLKLAVRQVTEIKNIFVNWVTNTIVKSFSK